MTGVTANYSFPFPELSDSPDGATQMENLATAIDTQVQSNADDAAASVTRAALLAALLGSGAGHITQFSTATTPTTTSTTYADLKSGSTFCGHSFVAPPSGIVRIGWGGGFLHSLSSGSTIFVGAAVATDGTVGSGTIITDAADNEALQIDGQNNTPGYKSRRATGLTPGLTYNCWVKWRESGSGTASAHAPWIESDPMLA